MPLAPSAAQSAASSGNAVRHGLAGRRITLDDHEAARLEALRADYAARRRPVGALEEAAIAAMALAFIRQDRADVMEVLVCDAIARKDASAWPTLGTVLRYRGRIEREQRASVAELDRLQQARRAAAAARDAATPARTNEPERPAAPEPQSRREAVTAPPPTPLNRHERRRREALERRAA